MNSTELTATLAQRLQLSKVEVNKRIEDMTAIITSELVNGNSLSISNFGSLEVIKRKERISVNPSSGKKLLIPPKLIVKFKAANSLKDKLKAIKP
jgi:nucleoid DNA-binding protein